MVGAGSSRVLLGTALQVWAAEVPELLLRMGNGGPLILALRFPLVSSGKRWTGCSVRKEEWEGGKVFTE